MSDLMGKLLSEGGPSYCTYAFSGGLPNDSLYLIASRIRGQLRNDDANSQVFVKDGHMVVKLDHALVDAQRGLTKVLSALKNSAAAKMNSVDDEASPAMSQHYVIETDPAGILQFARYRNLTMTQTILTLLIPVLQTRESVRLIVSFQPSLAEQLESGNHFVPVDIPVSLLKKMVTKSGTDWKKLVTRLAQSNAARFQKADQQDFASTDQLTVTSVGSLENLSGTLSRLGFDHMTMFPERVAHCPTVITIYSIFSRLVVVVSGEFLPDETVVRSLFTNPAQENYAVHN